MALLRVDIATPIAMDTDLTERAGLPLRLRDGLLRPGPGVLVEEDLERHLSDMRAVLGDDIPVTDRVEYRMLNGVRRAEDDGLADLPLRYELTAMTGRPLGWESAKTIGHVHVCPPGTSMGYPEVVEVVHGEAGFLVQDLSIGQASPESRRAWLVRARVGEWVVLPPDLAHVTIDLGAGPLVFSDVIDRRARGLYEAVTSARGFGWYVASDGELRPNPAYADPPILEEVSAPDWSGPAPEPLYRHFRDDPSRLAWLSDPASFEATVPGLTRRLRTAFA
jgi:glucose-6-phosphate isomerase